MEIEVPASHSKLIRNEETGEEYPLREYRSVTLVDDDNDNDPDNQLRCLLIRDRQTDKAALSTTVYPAGQLHDGPQWPGRAHLLEHLVFLGSADFPDENDLTYWLSQQGGNSNAYTDLELTCYYMDCRTAALEGTLQRWAAVLRQPLLSESVVEREIMAVDSEHAKNKPEDMWRTYQLSKTLMADKIATTTTTSSTPDHPYGQFGSGCLASLLPNSFQNGEQDEPNNPPLVGTNDDGNNKTEDATSQEPETNPPQDSESGAAASNTTTTDPEKRQRIQALRQAVWEFWDVHYLARNITVTVLSSQPLEEQEALVRKHFTSLLQERRKASSVDLSIPTVPPLVSVEPSTTDNNDTNSTKKKGPIWVQVVPIRPVYTLELHWPLRETMSLYEEKPTRVLSHLLGDEGPGSLLHVLRHEQPWVQELSADDGSRSTSAFSVLILQLELTQTGWQHVPEIIALVYAYIRLLSSPNVLPPHIYQELKLMGDMHFDFLGIPSSAVDAVSSLSVGMHHVPRAHQYLSGLYKYLAPSWNQSLLQTEFVRHLIPEHMLIVVGAPDYGEMAAAAADRTDWQTAPWYGTQYRLEPVPDNVLETWTTVTQASPLVQELAEQLHLPPPNEFVPSDFALVSLPPAVQRQYFGQSSTSSNMPPPPVCLLNDSDIQLWYKPDTEFSMPKVNIFISFPIAGGTTTSMMDSASTVETTLWTEWQNEVSNTFAYAASMAGLYGEWVANPKRSTIELHVSGYSHKAALFCRRLLETTVASTSTSTNASTSSTQNQDTDDKDKDDDDTMPLKDELWDRLVQKLRDQYHSFLMAQVYQHAIYCLDQCLEAVPTPRTIEQRMQELDQLQAPDLIRFHHQQFLTSHGLQILVHGNLTPHQAMELGHAIPQILRQGQQQQQPEESASSAAAASPEVKAKTEDAAPVKMMTTTSTRHTLQQRIVQLPPETNFVYRGTSWNEENTNHCALQYFPFGIMDLASNATLSLLRHLISERAYMQLRTQEQLGYIVHSQLKTSGDHIKALVLLVQGEVQDPVYMASRMQEFWQTVRTELVQLSKEEFETTRQSLYESFMEPKKNLMQESASHWNLITNQTFHFTRITEIAQHILTSTKQDVLRLLDKAMLYGSSITIQMFGQGVDIPTTTTTTITDETDKTVYLSDPIEFGRVQSLYALPRSVPVQVVNLDHTTKEEETETSNT